MINWEKYADLSDRFLRVQAKVQKISPDDFEDIRQSVFLHILICQVTVAALAQEELEQFIDQLVARYTKRWKRYRKRFKAMEDEQVPTVNETRYGELNESGLVILRLDVAAILQYMTARQVAICHCLMGGQTPRRVQAEIKCSSRAMTTELDQIRQHFLLFDYF